MWIDLTQEALDHLHNLATNLRTPVLGHRGLQTELRAYVHRTSAAIGQVIELDIDEDLDRIPPKIALATYRIIQEAVTNAIKHAGARQVKISVHRASADLVVSIRDRGPGFNVGKARNLATQAGCIGLLSMRERARSVGGVLEIKSAAGSGTCIRAIFPPEEYAQSHKRNASMNRAEYSADS
jgi:signal transduction histidine kinase